MGDAAVEGAADDGAAGLEDIGAAEVLPQAERDGRQDKAGAAAAAEVGVVVAGGIGLIGGLHDSPMVMGVRLLDDTLGEDAWGEPRRNFWASALTMETVSLSQVSNWEKSSSGNESTAAGGGQAESAAGPAAICNP